MVTQLSVSVNEPLMETLVIVSGAVPELVKVTGSGPLVEPTSGAPGKVRGEGEKVMPGPGVAPVPVSATGCGLPAALSATDNVAVIAVVVDAVLLGVNVTFTVHCAPPPASEPLQVFEETANSGSDVVNPVIVMAALPTLVRVTAMGELATPSAWLPKLSVCGFRASAGASAGPILAMNPFPEAPDPA